MKVSTLKKNPGNPRQIKGEKLELLKASVGGFQKMMALRPMIVDENNVVLGGNMRLAAIKALGLKEIPDDWVKQVTDLTADEKAEFVIKDNNSFGEYDWDAIANEWSDYPLADWGLDVPGFEAVDEVGEADAEPQIDKAAELNKKWGVVSGDLWQIGEHRLLCGDSTDAGCVSRLMDGSKAHMVFTDPPYNVAYQANESIESLKARNRRTDGLVVSNDSMTDEEFLTFLITALQNMPLKKGGAFYLCSPPGNPETDFRIAVRSVSGLLLKQCIVWVKNQFVFGRQDYHYRHESILYGWLEGEAHYFVDDHTQDTVWEIDRPRVSENHPTMKPLDVPTKAIANSSQHGQNVYEPFAGSGTTLVACENLNRKCYAIEISPDYCAVILERMATAFPDIEIKRIEDAKGKATT